MARKIELRPCDTYINKLKQLQKHGWHLVGPKSITVNGKNYFEFVRVNRTGGYENYRYYKVGLHIYTGRVIALPN